MKIIEISENKKEYLDLLLLADEQEDMIDRYLEKGKMYVLDDNGVKCECVITDEGNGVLEIKNIATVPEYQGKGYLNLKAVSEKLSGEIAMKRRELTDYVFSDHNSVPEVPNGTLHLGEADDILDL